MITLVPFFTSNKTMRRFMGVTAAFSKQHSGHKSLEVAQADQAPAEERLFLEAQAPTPQIYEDDEERQRQIDAGHRESIGLEYLRGQSPKESALRFHQSQNRQGEENMVQRHDLGAAARQKQTRRNFNETQPDAGPIGFDDSQPDSPAIVSSGSNGKRRYAGGEDEDGFNPSQDEGFQHDARVLDVNRRQTLPPSHRRSPRNPHPPKRQRSTQPSSGQALGDDEFHPIEDIIGEDEPEQQHSNNSSRAPVTSAYRATTQLSRQFTAAEPRPIQTRRPWSPEEEDRLIELVAAFGTSYAEMSKMDMATTKTLMHRSQVDLKDKCRVMRFNYHKYALLHLFGC